MLLEVEDLHVAFPIGGRLVEVVRGVSFTLAAGEALGLVGESGSGKSTMGYATLGLTPATGKIAFEGRDIAALGGAALRRLRARMQIVFQDPFGSLSPRLNVGEIVAEGLKLHEPHLTRAEREARVAEVLDEVGLPRTAAEHYPHEFSGGQRQRVAIARAAVLRPKFVVLDEPTSALDMSVQAQIVELLRRLQRDHDLGYLFISHDLKVIRALAHRVVVMRHGRVVEEGAAEDIFTRPREEYTKALMAAAFSLEAVQAEA
jgi:microcin C transport system ATP-binding protein